MYFVDVCLCVLFFGGTRKHSPAMGMKQEVLIIPSSEVIQNLRHPENGGKVFAEDWKLLL